MTGIDQNNAYASPGESGSLQAQWTRIGGGFTVRPATSRVDPERLIVDSAREAPADPRLFWVMASWMSVHYKLVDMRRLGRLLEENVDDLTSATAGAAAEVAASLANGAKPLKALGRHCRPLANQRPLFDVVARNPALRAIAKENARPEFIKWGFWHHEITDKTNAIRPVTWILFACPEFRYRSLFGADLEAAIIETIADVPSTVSDLARVTGASRPAVHEAIECLVARGLAIKPAGGYRREVSILPAVGEWLSAFLLVPATARPAL